MEVQREARLRVESDNQNRRLATDKKDQAKNGEYKLTSHRAMESDKHSQRLATEIEDK